MRRARLPAANTVPAEPAAASRLGPNSISISTPFEVAAMIKVLIADEHAIFREGLKRILDASLGLTVVAEAASGEEALERAGAAKPDVVLLDVSMPGGGGPETVQELKRREPRVRVLILTVHREVHFAVRFLRHGADGYITKDVAPAELVQAVRKVWSGGKYVSAELAELLAFTLESNFTWPPHEGLSSREFQVMRLIAAGKTSGEIGSALHLSASTVGTYRSRILIKMHMRNTAEIMRYAIEIGLAG